MKMALSALWASDCDALRSFGGAIKNQQRNRRQHAHLNRRMSVVPQVLRI